MPSILIESGDTYTTTSSVFGRGSTTLLCSDGKLKTIASRCERGSGGEF
jgi:hypothetical protein